MARYLHSQDGPDTSSPTEGACTPEEPRHQRRTAISIAALAIFQAPSRTEAEQRLQTFIATWAPVEPKAVKTFQPGIKHCVTFYQCAASLHPLVRSTNLLERFFREFRTKADEIGAFPNEDSCSTIFHLVMVREHAKHDRMNSAKTG